MHDTRCDRVVRRLDSAKREVAHQPEGPSIERLPFWSRGGLPGPTEVGHGPSTPFHLRGTTTRDARSDPESSASRRWQATNRPPCRPTAAPLSTSAFEWRSAARCAAELPLAKMPLSASFGKQKSRGPHKKVVHRLIHMVGAPFRCSCLIFVDFAPSTRGSLRLAAFAAPRATGAQHGSANRAAEALESGARGAHD